MNSVGKAARIVGGIGADEQYWEGLEQGRFTISQCADCKKWIWPAHFRCSECGSWDIQWTQVEPVGTVYTWTRTWYCFDRTRERAEDVPFVVVLAEIPAAGGARVMGVLTGSETGLKIGARVRGVIQPPSLKTKGYPSICWKLEQH